MTVFETLNNINVNDLTEKKNGLTYLSWASAWEIIKKHYPEASFTIYENEALGNMPYFTDGRTCMVKTGLTINGLEHIEYLPIMDYKNKSIPAEAVTSMDINKALQRSLTKAAARHGLGLYVYRGEDLPSEEAETKKQDKKQKAASELKSSTVPIPYQMTKENFTTCQKCGAEIKGGKGKDGKTMTAVEVAARTHAECGQYLCSSCFKNINK